MMVEGFTNSYLTHMQTSQVENICSQIFLLPVRVTTVKERCHFSWRKKGGGWGWNCSRGWECLFLLLLRVGSRCPFGVCLVLAHAPVPASKAGWEAGGRSAQLISVFFCRRQALQPSNSPCLMPKAALPAALTWLCIPFIQLKHKECSFLALPWPD